MLRFFAPLWIFILFFSSADVSAQTLNENGQDMGLFISSKHFGYSEDFYKEVSQFLTIDDDRSWIGKMKSEFIIRMGWLLQEQIQKLEKVDTLYFMNAEPKLGRALLDSYDFETKRYKTSHEDLALLQKIYVLNSFKINTRKHRSVYIRSNRMITEYIPIMVVSLNISVFDPANPGATVQTEVCFDAQTSTVVTDYFDLFAARSKLGKLLSNSYSQWWTQLLADIPSNCVK